MRMLGWALLLGGCVASAQEGPECDCPGYDGPVMHREVFDAYDVVDIRPVGPYQVRACIEAPDGDGGYYTDCKIDTSWRLIEGRLCWYGVPNVAACARGEYMPPGEAAEKYEFVVTWWEHPDDTGL